ncbi:hypothetical protein QN382_12175 [Pseudomonas sp. 10B1]|uniref:hypothetical protein n=1 Tax=unclassified Pseudomonas TaxID=196821 RepID=UPI002B230285|nr:MULTISPECIES: hypothetical protein [unclassified Pseudomonas]MEB0128023.1 hypothetical protein [Pseudomonas sp. CCC1.2]MEA9996201.1 hypothetical protein [Pseudomonas sp. AA4]MEB0088912.1 hypothetical protein [Pseudomonas sp. RTI1]MEB0219818.1 hypothetical protein [Pseudomonas sp. AB12(2023)]MEB0310042.1 hypothetical protein [Pseudomonas sp. 10B1]
MITTPAAHDLLYLGQRHLVTMENMEQGMVRNIFAVGLLGFSGLAMAQWGDVEYNATLKKEYIYCGSQRALDDFGSFAQDGDEDGANKMVSDGKCRISSGMKIRVFQENDYAASFLSPSGKAFYTYKKWLKR